jgi:uncharacterized peroxidase-related enzyme
MAHISIPPKVPGIRSLALFSPRTGKPLYELAQALLRNESPLSPAERELIAAYVSSLNRCRFCTDSHAAVARILFGARGAVVTEVLHQVERASVSPKLKALLLIAEKVQESGKNVSPEMIEKARIEGAEDREIHDTVLISAAFCMFNRYVDGLATLTPSNAKTYEEMGKHLASNGYIPPEKNN